MKYYVRFVRTTKWFSFEERSQYPEIDSDKVPAVVLNGIGSLKNNELSLFESDGNRSDLFHIGAAYSIPKCDADQISVVLIPQKLIKDRQFQEKKQLANTPIDEVNNRHLDLVKLSTDDINEIIKLMFDCKKVELQKYTILEKLKEYVEAEIIDESVLSKKLIKAIQQI